MNFLTSLLERVPWFPTALAWALALLILWLLAAFPASLIVTVIRAVRLRMMAWLNRYSDGLKAARSQRREQKRLAIETLRETRSLWMPRLASEVGAARKNLDRLGRQVQRTQGRLAVLTIPNNSVAADLQVPFSCLSVYKFLYFTASGWISSKTVSTPQPRTLFTTFLQRNASAATTRCLRRQLVPGKR
jgi:hypothetical protein